MNGVDTVLTRHPDASSDSLIAILQEVQEEEGYLSPDSMYRISTHLDMPASKVYGVATFYNGFRFSPIGEHNIVVCRGTACHVKGSARVLDSLQQELGIEPGEVTEDGKFSLEVVACIGACGLAPVITIGGQTVGEVQPRKVKKILGGIK